MWYERPSQVASDMWFGSVSQAVDDVTREVDTGYADWRTWTNAFAAGLVTRSRLDMTHSVIVK